jgi:hypothetical protein
MTNNTHWLIPETWDEARALLAFEPTAPADSGRYALQGLRVFVRDHKKRELPIEVRTLEARYGTFNFSQQQKNPDEARRAALETSYGRQPRPADVAGRAGRMYDMGPVPPPDDIDGQMPAVVAWHDGPMFYFLSSHEWSAEELLVVARSVYARRKPVKGGVSAPPGGR